MFIDGIRVSSSRRKLRFSCFLMLISLFLFPAHAWANAGTPLMWAGMLHLVFGNALIGLLEGLLIAGLFSVPKGKTISVMIPANYASAWIGGLLIRGAIVHSLPIDLNNGWRWVWVMVLVTYCMTLVLEWPFIAWCLRGTQSWLKRSVRASLVVQTASYLLLFGWYWMASGTSLYTKMNIVKPSDLSLPESVLVYFINPQDGDVYMRPVRGGNEQRAFELHSKNNNDRLFIWPNSLNTNRWDLLARLDTEDRSFPRLVPILTNMSVEGAPDWRSTHTEPLSMKELGSTLAKCQSSPAQRATGSSGLDSGRSRDFGLNTS